MKAAKVVLVTGATGGIGRDVALWLARRGFFVLASGRSTSGLRALQAEARGLPLHALELDVTSAESIARAVTEVRRVTKGHGVDVLVNNAGYGLPGALEEITDEELRAQFDTNVFGLMAVTRAFLPGMRARGAGTVINMSSISGRFTMPLVGAYHASKYAVEALSDALRMELSVFGIRVVLIEPGPVRSGFSQRTMDLVDRKRDAASTYAPLYARATEMRAKLEAQQVGSECVSRAVERAIDARRPRARYVVPWSSRVAVFVMALLPTRWSDALFILVVGLSELRPRRRGTVTA